MLMSDKKPWSVGLPLLDFLLKHAEEDEAGSSFIPDPASSPEVPPPRKKTKEVVPDALTPEWYTYVNARFFKTEERVVVP